MQANDFNYYLPKDLIAQQARRRGHSRLLILDRKQKKLEDTQFGSIVRYFNPGDCLVINDTKVIAARLWARKISTQATIELLLHQRLSSTCWTALARPVRRLKPDTELEINQERFRVIGKGEKGEIKLAFQSADQANYIIEHFGSMPLPPYIKRPKGIDGDEQKHDKLRYQTVFAKHQGSVAAPTSGLHFSKRLLQLLHQQGINVVPITLHVGWGTFSTLPDGPLNNMKLHDEYFNISAQAADIINNGKARGKKIIACGTTATRTLEANVNRKGLLTAGQGRTDLFIKPGYRWKMVDRLITNFHLPRSSLLMLVSAFAGKRLTMSAYQHAIKENYRFFSYGDAMLIL